MLPRGCLPQLADGGVLAGWQPGGSNVNWHSQRIFRGLQQVASLDEARALVDAESDNFSAANCSTSLKVIGQLTRVRHTLRPPPPPPPTQRPPAAPRGPSVPALLPRHRKQPAGGHHLHAPSYSEPPLCESTQNMCTTSH